MADADCSSLLNLKRPFCGAMNTQYYELPLICLHDARFRLLFLLLLLLLLLLLVARRWVDEAARLGLRKCRPRPIPGHFPPFFPLLSTMLLKMTARGCAD